MNYLKSTSKLRKSYKSVTIRMFSVTTNRTFLNQLGVKTKFGVSQKSGRGGLDSLAAWWLDAIIQVPGSSSLSAQSTAGRH